MRSSPKGSGADALVRDLRAEYSACEAAPPEWSHVLPSGQPLRATIPFVGKRYPLSSPRLGVFASAENLAHYERQPETIPRQLLDDRAQDRHRATREEHRASDPESFWPHVHIGPVENGSLLCAALFVRSRVGGAHAVESPSLFVEELLLANVCKFSKAGPRNRDYLGCMRDVRPSLHYLRADLRLARPEVLLFPKAALGNREVREVLAEACPSARVLPVPQFNAGVVNRHLGAYHARALELQEELRATKLGAWMSRLRGYSPGYAYRYLALLEALLV